MDTKIVLVDVNPRVIIAFRRAFEDAPDVTVVQGSLLAQRVDAWVSPTNSQGKMDGGLDAAVRGHIGVHIQARVRAEIAQKFGGFLPVGAAVCVPTGRAYPRYLISAPTMSGTSDDVSATLNVALACCAAFQTIGIYNRFLGGNIRSVALPGLGAGTGRVSAELCADLVWTAYSLFREEQFEDFSSMRLALEKQVGSLGPLTESSAWEARAAQYRASGAASHA